MDRCIYVDTGPLILWQMRGLDMYNRYVQIYFPIQKKKEWSGESWQAGYVGWHGSGGLLLLSPYYCPLPTVEGHIVLSTKDPSHQWVRLEMADMKV